MKSSVKFFLPSKECLTAKNRKNEECNNKNNYIGNINKLNNHLDNCIKSENKINEIIIINLL